MKVLVIYFGDRAENICQRKGERNHVKINKDSQAFGLSSWVSIGAISQEREAWETTDIQGEEIMNSIGMSWIRYIYSYLSGDVQGAIGYMSLDFRWKVRARDRPLGVSAYGYYLQSWNCIKLPGEDIFRGEK